MKILLAGDTHGNTKHVQYLLDMAVEQNCDRIFQLGDFGYWEHERSGVTYLDNVQKHASLHGVPVYFLDGNHDKTSLLLKKYGDNRNSEGFIVVRPGVRYAPRGHVWEWCGKTFIAFGGAYSVDKPYRLAQEHHDEDGRGGDTSETLWFPEEEMTDEEFQTLLAEAPNTVDFMFTHDKPRTSKPGWNRKDLQECWPNQDRIQAAVKALKPHLIAHGHLHYRYDDTITTPHGRAQVLGLDADPWAASRSYRRENSWYVLDTEA